jgi:hypothetical protein
VVVAGPLGPLDLLPTLVVVVLVVVAVVGADGLCALFLKVSTLLFCFIACLRFALFLSTLGFDYLELVL